MKKILIIISMLLMDVWGEEITELRSNSFYPSFTRDETEELYRVYDIHIIPNTKNMAINSRDKDIHMFNVKTGELSYVLKGHTKGVYTLDVSKDGKTLISSSFDKTIKIWDLEKRILIKSIKIPKGKVRKLIFGFNEQTIIGLERWRRKIWIWDRDTGTLIKEFKQKKKHILSLLVGEERGCLITGNDDGSVTVLDIEDDFKELYSWRLAYGAAESMYLYKGKIILGGDSAQIEFWEKNGDKYTKSKYKMMEHNYNDLFKIDEDIILASENNQGIAIYDILKNEWLRFIFNQVMFRESMAIDAKNEVVVTGGKYGCIVGSDMETGKKLYTISINKDKHPQKCSLK